jgi:Transposase IS116/IS110/IS902 family
VAAIGGAERFASPQKLVGYLGLNPSVRQSGPGPAHHGRITKQGGGHARGMLVEAAWAAARVPRLLRAFFQRVGARLHARKMRNLELKAGHKPARGQRGAAHAYNLRSHREQERRSVILEGHGCAQARRKRGATIEAAWQGSHLMPCSLPRDRPCTTETYAGHRRKSANLIGHSTEASSARLRGKGY